MPALSIMVKPASGMCNLRCKYCFYHDVAERRDVPNAGCMTRQTAHRLIDQALEYAAGQQISFAFQGGEPLLAGMDYFRDFVAYTRERNVSGSPVFFSLQTNGMLVDDAWASFFRENQFLIGLSLDGDRPGNKYRIDAQKQNSFDRILAAANILEKHQVEFNILTVVTGYTARNIERIYAFFKKQGFRYLQFIPCLRPFGDDTEGGPYMTDEAYESFLVNLFTAYVRDYARGDYVSIRQFDNWVHLYLGDPAEQCGLCGHCSQQFVAEGDGSIYPCDFYCLDEWKLGNINTDRLADMAASDKAAAFIRESYAIPEKCRSCDFAALCRAQGCKRNRADYDHCKAYQGFFSKCMTLFDTFAGEKRR